MTESPPLVASIRLFALQLGNSIATEHADLCKTSGPIDSRRHKTTLGQLNQAIMFLAENAPIHVIKDIWIVPSKSGGRPHRVTGGTEECDCDMGLLGKTCWAAIAVHLWQTAKTEVEKSMKEQSNAN